MSISVERVRDTTPGQPEAPHARGAMWPEAGQKVPENACIHAMRGILWSVTLGRAMLVPVFLAGALRLQELVARGLETGALRWGLVLTLAVIAASDVLDGWLARRYGLASMRGAIADALADKLAQVAIVAFFTFFGGPPFASLPLWFFLLVLGRDLALGGGWLVLSAGGVPFQPVHRIHGRAGTAAVFFILLWLATGLGARGFTPVLLLTSALIWVSLASYLAEAWTAVRLARRGKEGHTFDTGGDR